MKQEIQNAIVVSGLWIVAKWHALAGMLLARESISDDLAGRGIIQVLAIGAFQALFACYYFIRALEMRSIRFASSLLVVALATGVSTESTRFGVNPGLIVFLLAMSLVSAFMSFVSFSRLGARFQMRALADSRPYLLLGLGVIVGTIFRVVQV